MKERIHSKSSLQELAEQSNNDAKEDKLTSSSTFQLLAVSAAGASILGTAGFKYGLEVTGASLIFVSLASMSSSPNPKLKDIAHKFDQPKDYV